MIEATAIGTALRAVRSAKGFSQIDAAKASGFALTVLNRAEKGKSLLTLKSLLAFLDGIGADLHDFARALDLATGRTPEEMPGRANARWVAMMGGRPLDEDWLYGFAAAVLDPGDAQAREDFVASVATVAAERARRVIAAVDAPVDPELPREEKQKARKKT